MTTTFSAAGAATAPSILGEWAQSSSEQNVRNSTYERGNVSRHGALGNFVQDDTAALNDAALSVAQLSVDFSPQRTVGGVVVNSVGIGSGPVLRLPRGRYKLTGPIDCGAYAEVSGDHAILDQQDDAAAILRFSNGYMNVVRGLKFVGGANQILWQNDNLDGACAHFIDCEFHLSSAAAVKLIGTGVTVPGDLHLSSLVIFERCKFMWPRQALVTYSDHCKFVDCVVYVKKENFTADTAVFENRSGNLHIEDMFGVPVMGEGGARMANVRWVDNWNGRFEAQRTRFGGEHSGMAIVYCRGTTKPTAGNSFIAAGVRLFGCELPSGPFGRSDSGIIHLRDGVPSQIVVVGNTWAVDNDMVVNSGAVDLDTYFDTVPTPDSKFKFKFGPNMGGANVIPAQLVPFANAVNDNEVTDTRPTVGWWRQGQRIGRLTTTFGDHSEFVSVKATSETPVLAYGNVPGMFPGRILATNIGGGQAKVTLTIPPGVRYFQAEVTMSCNPNPGADGKYRVGRSDIIEYCCDAPAGQKDSISSTPKWARAPGSFTAPSVVSVHFGTADTGTATQAPADAAGTTISIVYGNCSTSTVTFASVRDMCAHG